MSLPTTFDELLKRLKEKKDDVSLTTKSGERHKGKIQYITEEFFQLELKDQGAGAPSIFIRTDAVDYINVNNPDLIRDKPPAKEPVAK